MISVYYLFEKLSVNQHIWANTELERRVREEKDPERKKKLLKARDRASEKASAEAWKREPVFMKDEQKDRQAKRLRRAAYDQTTRPDLEADIARKTKVAKRKLSSLSSKIAKTAKEWAKPVPALGSLQPAVARVKAPVYQIRRRTSVNVPRLRRKAA